MEAANWIEFTSFFGSPSSCSCLCCLLLPLFFLLPHAVVAAAFPVSVSFSKGTESFDFLFTAFYFSTFWYNILNWQPRCSQLCLPINLNPLPSLLLHPALKLWVCYTSQWTQRHSPSPIHPHPKPSEWVSIHTSLPIEIQFVLKALLTQAWAASIPQNHCQCPWKWNAPSEHTALCLTCNMLPINKRKELNWTLPFPKHT